ncbi:hypothetical protein Y88_2130 [Novosphingobium nitrogenifigens DSM 19370]|uniref:Uncharacterized protein n=1 Tax=Novosphingobium nitrogenifigens DSM 19370 TaxID=983920 RepID=F1Z578_9SPHN|nr:hypothetical protein Y88_2130 [Novosphingobium nitrogenifigens DSM 19370]
MGPPYDPPMNIVRIRSALQRQDFTRRLPSYPGSCPMHDPRT